MITVYKYIYFAKAIGSFSYAKPSWNCINNKTNDYLGHVDWYQRWKRYVYTPRVSTVYSVDCLKDIIDFISQLEKQR